MTTLQDLKTAYQNQLDQWEAENTARDQAREAARQAILDNLRPRVVAYLAKQEGVDESEFDQLGTLTGDWDEYPRDDNEQKLNRVYFTLTIPEHQKISFGFYEDREGKIRPSSKTWDVPNSGRHPGTLGQALVIAAETWQSEQEYEATQAADEQDWQNRQATKKEQEQREQSELQSILTQIATDPAAVLILKLFAAIQQERAGVTEQLTNLEQSAESAMYYHEAEISATREKAHRYQQEAQKAEDSTRSLQYQVDDLESDLKKAKRQRS